MFSKFQAEVYGMTSCKKSIVDIDGEIMTYAIKERALDKNGNLLPPKEYEVRFNRGTIEDFFYLSLIPT